MIMYWTGSLSTISPATAPTSPTRIESQSDCWKGKTDFVFVWSTIASYLCYKIKTSLIAVTCSLIGPCTYLRLMFFGHHCLQFIFLSSGRGSYQRTPETSMRTEVWSLYSSVFSLPTFCKTKHNDKMFACVVSYAECFPVIVWKKIKKINKNRSQTAQTDPVETIHKLVRLSQLLICHEGRRLDDRWWNKSCDSWASVLFCRDRCTSYVPVSICSHLAVIVHCLKPCNHHYFGEQQHLRMCLFCVLPVTPCRGTSSWSTEETINVLFWPT